MEQLDALEAARVAREVELLEERHALDLEEQGRFQAATERLRRASSRRRDRLEAAGFQAPAAISTGRGEPLEWLERLAPLLEMVGPTSGPLVRVLEILRQAKGVQAMKSGSDRSRGAGSSRSPSLNELASLLKRGGDPGQDPIGLAQGQRLDRQAASFLRSLGVEAREGEEMGEALRRIASGLNSGRKQEMKEKASSLLEGLLGPEEKDRASRERS